MLALTKRPPRKRRAPRVERARRPAGARDEERDRPGDVDVVRPGRPGKQGNAGEAEGEPDHGCAAQALSAGDTIEERHPQRHGGDDQRGDAGVDALLGPGDARVPDQEQRRTDDGRGSPFAAARAIALRVAAADRPGVEQPASDREAERRHHEHGERPARDQDEEVGRAPDDVDDRKRGPDTGRARRALHEPSTGSSARSRAFPGTAGRETLRTGRARSAQAAGGAR